MPSSKRQSAGASDPFGRALQSVRRFLRFGNRSVAETRAYLTQHDIPAPLHDALIDRCAREGQLDDHACARVVAAHLADRGLALVAIRERLLTKGLDPALVDSVLASLPTTSSDAGRALTLARAHAARHGWTGRDGQGKLARWLASKGFDDDTIEQTVSVIIPDA